MEYILFGEIRAEIANHFHRYHQGLTFYDAVKKLQLQKKTHTNEPAYPDFLAWDICKVADLLTYAEQLPIALDEIFQTKETYSPGRDEYSLSENLPLQIALESIYAPDYFQNLPFIYISYVLNGSAEFYTKDAHYTLAPGTLLIIAPHLPFRIFCTPEDLVLQIGILSRLFEAQMSQLIAKNEMLSYFFQRTLKQQQKEFLRFVLPPDQQILEIIKHLFVEFKSKEAFSTEAFLDYLQLFYVQILRNCDTNSAYQNRSPSAPVTIFPSISLYIQRNYQTVTLEALAKHFNYSPAYMSRMIKKETGRNLSEILSDLKLKEAKRLLADTAFSITQIAELSGFQSANHFTHSFKTKAGMSPREYRMSYRTKG